MCLCAEEISFFQRQGFGRDLKDPSYKPTAFKPGVADKFLFNKIIQNISLDSRGKGNNRVWGIKIMNQYFYPNYNWCVEKELEEARD